MPRSLLRLGLAMLGLASAAMGCGKGGLLLGPNAPPTLELTSGPIDTSATNPVAWSVPIVWDARDADGSIDHVSYAVDPPTPVQVAAGAETVWVRTKANGVVARFGATRPDSLVPGATASDFHVFVARAWDNSGGASEQVVRAFYASTVAPTATIERPRPDVLFPVGVPPSFNLHVSGDDPDGIGSRRPASFRVRLVNELNPLFRVVARDPDSLRREAVASDWRHWSTFPGDQSDFPLRDLPDGSQWLVALVAVDAAGAITPTLSFDRNLLRLAVSVTSGPRLRVTGPGLDFTYPDGSDSPDSTRWLDVEYPATTTAEFQWSAFVAPGRSVTGFRWALDPYSLDSELPRESEATDLRRWSRWSLGNTRTGALPPWITGDHLLCVQVEDDLGSRSLGIVRIRAFPLGLQRPLLVVDDTRLELDRLGTAECVAPYLKPWPSAVELDTFLFAVGNVPWRCAVNPPEVLSPPGLFAGYDADTLNTRLVADDMSRVLSLAKLLRYRHVLWLTEIEGALGDGLHGSPPVTMMRWMAREQSVHLLADYAHLGGRVWLAGGGVALASLIEYDSKLNNTPVNTVFATGRDLSMGSVVVSSGHLRHQVSVTRTSAALTRSPAARGGWRSHGPAGALDAPSYARLPTGLALKTSATDPIPATRTASQASLFYRSGTSIEYAHGSLVVEDFGAPGASSLESALDTLLDVAGSNIQGAPAPTMLYYHGRENGPVLFSGFDLWSWSRAECQALVDFVLQDVWGLSKTPALAGSKPASDRTPRARTPAPRARNLDPAQRAP